MHKSKKFNKWLEDVRAAEEYLKTKSSRNEWSLYREAYRGHFGTNVIPINLVYAIVKNLIPRVYFRNPHVSVVSKRSGFEGNAMVVEHLDNLLIRELDMRKVIKTLIVDSFLCGFGVLKMGYSYEFGDSFVKEGDEYKILEKKVEYNSKVKRNFPWAKRVLPEHLLIPAGTYDLDSIPWIGTIYYRPVEDVQKDPRFKHTEGLRGTAIVEMGSDKKEVEMIKLYEVYDKREWKIYTIAEGSKDFLQSAENSLPIVPIEILSFSESVDTTWFPPSDVESFFPLQLELNEIETQIQAHRRIAVKRFTYKNGVFGSDPETALEKFTSEDVGVGIGLDGNPKADLSELELEIPQTLFQAKDNVLNSIREIVGMSQNQLGAFVGKTHIAEGEGRRVQGSMEERMSERRDEVANFLTRTLEKLNNVIFDKWDAKRVEPIIGPDMVEYWVEYKGDQIRGEYNVQVSGEDIAPLNTQYRMEELTGLVQLLASNPLIDQSELTRQVVGMVRGFDGARLLKPVQTQGGPEQPVSPREMGDAVISGRMPQVPQAVGGTPQAGGASGGM